MDELIHLTDHTNLPLSSNQKRLWILYKQDNTNPAYNLSGTYHIKGDINLDIFRKSMEILFNRNHTVFSVFKHKNNEPYIEIIEQPVVVEVIDFTHLPVNKREDVILKFAGDEARKCFNIEKGPLYRLYLLKSCSTEHYFIFTFPHIVFDGYSLIPFISGLSKIYNNLLNNNEYKIEPLLYQSYDFAAMEHKSEWGEFEQRMFDFWKDCLKDCPVELKFPYDFPRKKFPSGLGFSEPILISDSTSEKLKKLSKDTNTSLFAAMMSILGILMLKYTNEDDICIGFPVSDRRKHPALKEIIGFFVNTTVARLEIDRNTSFKECLVYTKGVASKALRSSKLPFEKIIEAANLERRPNLNPLYQVAISSLADMFVPLDLNGSLNDRIDIPGGTSPYDMQLYFWEKGDLIEGEIEYATDLLKQETVVRLKNSFLSLVENLTNNPDLPISEISAVSEDEKKKIFESNNTDVVYEDNICIHKKFEQVVENNPDNIALFFDNHSLTYRELNDHANRMANSLIDYGVEVEDVIGICIDRSVEMMIGIFGILKAGAAYMPLATDTPVERMENITSDSKTKLILTTRNSSVNIPRHCRLIYIDDIIKNPLSGNSSNPNVNVNSRNLAYIIYTSGSTGTPKGAMIEHHSVLNRLGWMQKAYPLDHSDTLVQKTPITFDVSVWELFWWSFNGAKLVLLPKGGEKEPETLIKHINKYSVTTIHFVPSMFAVFFEVLKAKKLFEVLKSLRLLFLSGEALPVKLVREFNEMRANYSLPDMINLYGPTEATVDVSYYNCPKDGLENVYIGKPIDNTKLFVLDKNNQIQPIGVTGELIITGVNLARGYLNKHELTSQKFFDFKITENNVVRAYRTGDLVKFTAEGEIDYIGRLDNQVKIRGFRIELGDIESKIMEHNQVTNCAVTIAENVEPKSLIAYICLKTGTETGEDDIRKFLSQKLPDYMLPSYYSFMDSLPLTSSGKLNRKKLPGPVKTRKSDSIVSPTSNTEKKLLDLWKGLLNIENIGISDNFFDVGGNSLLAISLATAISEEFAVDMNSIMVFNFPTIKGQSDFISGGLKQENKVVDDQSKRRRSVNFKKHR